MSTENTNTESILKRAPAPFEPKIMAFVCNWCTYAGADLAGTGRMEYKPNVRIIKLPCTGRIDPLFILKAFDNGADGVLVSGCHPGDCHYTTGNYHARRRWIGFKNLMEFTGIDTARVHFSWISASEAIKWVDLINNVTDKIAEMGPFTEYKELKKVKNG
ncbi:MAG: hydrogenase iron-sulfur subunit [Deltaproteobacteria bacterium]|nr:hydrogenase iron-sulfur subunit [Deltaproteobacteria bacterium]